MPPSQSRTGRGRISVEQTGSSEVAEVEEPAVGAVADERQVEPRDLEADELLQDADIDRRPVLTRLAPPIGWRVSAHRRRRRLACWTTASVGAGTPMSWFGRVTRPRRRAGAGASSVERS